MITCWGKLRSWKSMIYTLFAHFLGVCLKLNFRMCTLNDFYSFEDYSGEEYFNIVPCFIESRLNELLVRLWIYTKNVIFFLKMNQFLSVKWYAEDAIMLEVHFYHRSLFFRIFSDIVSFNDWWFFFIFFKHDCLFLWFFFRGYIET